MDSDDIMLPDRIEKEFNFLQNHPEVIAVGGQCQRIDENGNSTGMKTFPLTHPEIHDMLFCSIPIQQPTLMIKRSMLPSEFTWYRKELLIGEDWDIYYRLMKYGKLANLPDTVLKYREYPKNLTLSSQKRTFWYIWKTRWIALTQYGYLPKFTSIINVLAQTVAVVVLPEKILYPLHLKTRTLFHKIYT
jgi:hypothetical protein